MPEVIILTRNQVRRVDQIAMERFGLPGVVLMENAGRGCVDVLCSLGCRGPVVVLCGAGNNAGDGFVIARHLEVRQITALCVLANDPERLTGDAAINFQVLDKLGLAWQRADNAEEQHLLAEAFSQAEWIVDALLGTGAIGPPRPAFVHLIELANRARAKRLAVDLPSGLDCDTGAASQPTFRADHTCTFVAAKPGLVLPEARPYVGQLHVLDIGVPDTVIAAAQMP
jgi:NAD(P)H-hydrate epimerase